jgi:hypothetical protein
MFVARLGACHVGADAARSKKGGGMGAQSQDITERQFARVEELITRVTAAPDTAMAALKVIGPEMLSLVRAYKTEDAAVAALERASAKELVESQKTMMAVAAFYDQAREVVMAKVRGVTFLAASTYTTAQDFLNQAEALEDVLEEQAAAQADAPEGTGWAARLFAAMTPLLDAAVKEYNEATGAVADLQKARLRRASAAAAARPVFVQVRRVVRSTFGRRSREYRSLLDARGQVEPDEPATLPAPPTPGAPTEPVVG